MADLRPQQTRQGGTGTGTEPAKGSVLAGLTTGKYTPLAVGTNGQALLADSTETAGVKWGTIVSTPGGNDTEFQYNDGGAFAGSPNFYYDKLTGHIFLKAGKRLYFDG